MDFVINLSSKMTKCVCIFRHLGREVCKFWPWLRRDQCKWYAIV